MTEDNQLVQSIEGRDSDEIRGIVRNMKAKHVAFLGWLVAAGCYGYAAATWGSASVDMSTVQPYPEYSWLFFLFGLSIGVAFSASIVAMPKEGLEEK